MNGRAQPKIIVLGSMCRLPVAGVVYQILHYLIGFERLGFKAYYVEWHGNWVEDPTLPCRAESPRLCIDEVMRAFGFQDRWICRGDQVASGYTFGALSGKQLGKLCREAEAIINVTGAHFMEGELLHCSRRVYVESDPGIPQIRLASGDAGMQRLINGHTHFFTFGENIHGPGCLLPETGVDYRTTRQPVVLDLWRHTGIPASPAYTTIARWRKPKDKAIDFGGQSYRWNKDGEFEKVLNLPALSREAMELALSEISPVECRRLEAHGWKVIDAIPLSSSLGDYRSYIRHSRGEFTIAKDQYVRLKTGWFSDRSASYLAAGRPVITQDTGFGCSLPTGEGLFAFRTPDDVLAAMQLIRAEYDRQCAGALEIAREYFDSDKVLSELLRQIGLDPAGCLRPLTAHCPAVD